VVHIPDVEVDPEYQHNRVPRGRLSKRPLGTDAAGRRSIGVIRGDARRARQFSDNEIELLKTFADQAVIAIENVRFKELQAGNREIEDKSAQLEVASQHKV